MIQTDNKEKQKIIERVYHYNQDHVFRFWDELDQKQKDELLEQIDSIDFDLLNRQIKQVLADHKPVHYKDLHPPEVVTLNRRKNQDKQVMGIGEKAIARGKTAALLVAGGQGTRLGFDGPKGEYPVTPVKQKSLFQLHAEKLIAIGRRYKTSIPWYIMTSQTNKNQTVQFFKDHDYFGYQKGDIFFFTQEMIPAIDRKGKLILDEKDHIFMNPNGHGGSIKALDKSGALQDMKERGADFLFYFQVDNVLTRICDPIYFGYHIDAKSEMSSKVVHKKYAEEKMGILCKVSDKLHLIEYSDLSHEDMHAVNPDGSLKFWAGNIATHIFDRQFLERENEGGFRLPYHIAEKSIPYIDQNGKKTEPDKKNGVKFETFVFDALEDARATVCVEVEREMEFSPLKNSKGENSPTTVRNDLLHLYRSWLETAGYKIPLDKNGKPQIEVEISPLAALSAGDLIGKQIDFDKGNRQIYIEKLD